MSTATRATGSRSLTAWSFGPFATVPSYQSRPAGCANVRGEVAGSGRDPDHGDVTSWWSWPRRCHIAVVALGATSTSSEAGGVAELGGPVGALPGEIGLGAAEVPVRGGLRVDGPEQVERV